MARRSPAQVRARLVLHPRSSVRLSRDIVGLSARAMSEIRAWERQHAESEPVAVYLALWRFLSRRTRLGLRAEKHPRLARLLGLGPRRLPLVRRPRFRWSGRPANHIDFSRGIAELAAAATEGRPSRLPARWSLHVNELALAIQDPATYGSPRELRSTFEPLSHMPWAS